MPVGKDRKYGADMNSFLDAIVGGWSLDGVFRLQTGEMIDFGNVRLVGMTKSDLQKEIKVQGGAGGQIFILPADILDNTVQGVHGQRDVGERLWLAAVRRPAATSRRPTVPTASRSAPGYGDCGLRSVAVNGPSLMRLDLGIAKKFDSPGASRSSSVARCSTPSTARTSTRRQRPACRSASRRR